MTGTFEALAVPTRRRILELLVDGEQPVTALVGALQSEVAISQPAVSQHLAVLREAGLVTVRIEGRRHLHALDPSGLDGALAWLAQLAGPLDAFAQPMNALATEVARGRWARRGAVPDDGAAAAGA